MNETKICCGAFSCSGAHRPVGGESGEYLYCPPQRWLNNLQVCQTMGRLISRWKGSTFQTVVCVSSMEPLCCCTIPAPPSRSGSALLSWPAPVCPATSSLRTLTSAHTGWENTCHFLTLSHALSQYTVRGKGLSHHLFGSELTYRCKPVS